MTLLALVLMAAPVVLLGYASIVYPGILWMLARHRGAAVAEVNSAGERGREDWEWPSITITVPAYNEERSIRRTLERLLELDYPADRVQILVISDASTGGTDAVVREFTSRGVELLRLPGRSGKTAAENAAAARARGEILVNIDASVQVAPGALRPLVHAFADPTVGVASGRDVSVGAEEVEGNRGEAGYVGYEMWVRGLETRVHSIVGASGCFFATRRRLFDDHFPEELSRDFASALIARERGYRSVSVADALCFVPRTRSLAAEFRRKIRTMARGLATLEYKRHLMSPERYGLFAWMLMSHKLARWLFYVALPFSLAGLVLLALTFWPARVALAAFAVGGIAGVAALVWPEGKRVPAMLALPGFLFISNLAGVLAWWRYLSGERQAVWEPTRRPGESVTPGA